MVMTQALTIEKDATIPTCNLSEIVHNKWLEAFRNKMVDLYHATLDDYSRATFQSICYYNYPKGRGRRIGHPSKSLLQLWLAIQSENSSRVVKLVDEISPKIGVNTRIAYLEDEKIFGSIKQKLNLPPGDESDSHRHDCMYYFNLS